MLGRLHDLALPLVAVAVVLAGCVGGPVDFGTPEPTPATPATPEPTTQPNPTTTTSAPETTVQSRETLEPMSPPWKPDPLVAGNVEVYVREYERMVRYNEVIGPSVTDVELRCRAALVTETDSAFVVRAECGGSIHSQSEDGATSVGSFASEEVTYVLDDSSIQRIEGVEREVDAYRPEDGENAAEPETIAVVNAHDQEHELGLTVHYEGEDAWESVLEQQHNLTASAGVDLEEVVAREGTYNVTVELDDGTAVQHRWRVAAASEKPTTGIVVVVTPEAELLVVDMPRVR